MSGFFTDIATSISTASSGSGDTRDLWGRDGMHHYTEEELAEMHDPEAYPPDMGVSRRHAHQTPLHAANRAVSAGSGTVPNSDFQIAPLLQCQNEVRELFASGASI